MTMKKQVKYVQISKEEVPANIRFDVPRENQGQIIEVAYGCSAHEAMPAEHGDAYQRVTDRSDNSVQYFRRIGSR